MKVLLLTSSRADYGIYTPLLKQLKSDNFFKLKVLAFGMHTAQKLQNLSLDNIKSDGYDVDAIEDVMIYGDDKSSAALAMGDTTKKIAEYLTHNHCDLVICLGDRYEMFAAVSAVVPFNTPIAHVHGGEQTEGAIDNKFRHALTKLSDFHFTTCEKYQNRIIQMGAKAENVINVGSLGVQNIKETNTISKKDFLKKYNVDLNKDTALITFHPTTNELDSANEQATNFITALENTDIQLLITLGNLDPKGEQYQKLFLDFAKKNLQRVFVFESLGFVGYYTAMEHSKVMIGNSSSGIIEGASFNLPVVNVGNRQKGRETSKNTITCSNQTSDIEKAIQDAISMIGQSFKNVYEQDDSANKIINFLKNTQMKLDLSFNDLKEFTHG